MSSYRKAWIYHLLSKRFNLNRKNWGHSRKAFKALLIDAVILLMKDALSRMEIQLSQSDRLNPMGRMVGGGGGMGEGTEAAGNRIVSGTKVYELSKATSPSPSRRIVGRCKCESRIRKACTRKDVHPWLMGTPCCPATISRECTPSVAETASDPSLTSDGRRRDCTDGYGTNHWSSLRFRTVDRKSHVSEENLFCFYGNMSKYI